MSAQYLIFVAAVGVYVLGGLYYARAALNDAGPICRVSFVGRKFAALALGVGAIEASPEGVWIFVAYVIASLWSWFIAAAQAHRSGDKRVGFARIMAE